MNTNPRQCGSPTLCGVLTLGMTLAIGAVGCEPPPDTSPVVTIVSPIEGQKVAKGMPIDVRFSVGGFDSTGPTMVKFQLANGATKEFGQGRVRAYLNSNTYYAQAITLPDDANPFLVPDASLVDPMTAVTAGKRELRLILFYNGDPSMKVTPQREGIVNVIVE